MELLPHNRVAYEAVVNHLKHSNRTCVIHPTGTGKSYIALQLIEDNRESRILYITSVATNLLEFWEKVEKLDGFRMVLNLSNIPKHIGTGVKGDLDTSDTIAEVAGLASEDTDSEIIDDEERQEMLKKATEVDESYMKGPLIQFCLYAGLDNLLPDFDLIIVDEFHRAGAPLWKNKVQHLLDENTKSKIVGFSATPVRMDGRDMRDLFNNDVASEMLLSQAIVNGLLPLPKYWLGKIEFDEVLDDLGPSDNAVSSDDDLEEERLVDNSKNKQKKQNYSIIAKRHLEAGTGLRESFQEALTSEDAAHGKFIIFCRTIRNTRVLKRLSEDWFGWVDEVHRYEMHSAYREGFYQFTHDDSDSLRLLFVVDMLTEGVHLDDLDGVIMVRPTESERIYFQQLGRALAVTTQRKHPMIFDIVSNAAVMKGGMDFFKGIGKEMHLDEDEMKKFFHITTEAADFIAYLEETEYDYDAALQEFYDNNGHLYIPQDYMKDGHDVYSYFCRIRGRKNQLSPQAKEKYEAMGMDWDITTRWMTGYWAAQDYYLEFKNFDVPSTLGDYHGVWLYPWLQRNRENKKFLCSRQIELLDGLGMDWNPHDIWEDMFKELLKYKNQYGHVDVPGDYGRLGKWVAELRKRPPEGERRERLDQIDFEWDGRQSRSRNAWRQGVVYATEYWRSHGDLKVPGGYITSDGYKLGNFVKKTKQNHRLDDLIEAVQSCI